MKISRRDLKALIAEELKTQNSVLLEMPLGSTTGTAMGALDNMDKNDSGPAAGNLVKRSLYHMSQQAQQLHDILIDGENLEQAVEDDVSKAAEFLEKAFKTITYEKGPGQG